jgi:hypothetical protein
MNAVEHLRTLGRPWTQYEATGRLVKERYGGRKEGVLFLREREKLH